MSAAYQYSALKPNNIRILSINAGNPDDDLCIKLQCYELNQLPPFSALSYCWGEFESGHDCFCEDGNSSGRITISPNLWAALRQFRRVDDHIEVWADQICIDQKNEPEKEGQIRFMESIYSLATNVVVWLGEADEDTEILFQHIEDVGKQMVHLASTLGPERAHNPENPRAAHLPFQLSSGNAREWVAFRKLFKRQWFSRVWTFQELVLSNAALLQCGPKLIGWDGFYVICASIRAYDRQNLMAESRLQESSTVYEALSQCRAVRRGGRYEHVLPGGKDQLRLLDLVYRLMEHKTSQPHDKIYGLLGVAEDVDASSFPIDYEQHFRDFYAQMTKFFIRQYADLSVLCLVNAGAFTHLSVQGPRNLPSWVPDYRFNNFQDTNLRLYNGPQATLHGKERMYNATGSTSTMIHEMGSLLQLELRGVSVRMVNLVSEPDGNTYTKDMLKLGENVLTGNNWSRVAVTCGSGGVYMPTGESIEQAFNRLRIVDCLPEEFDAERRRSRKGPDRIPEPRPDANMYEQDDPVGRRIMTATYRQRLFVTNSGYIGVAHQHVTVGDEVYLLMGGDMPFILRRLVNGTFSFKGEAYVHGIMDGEFLVKHFKSSNVSDQDWLNGLADLYSKELRTEALVLS